MSASVHGDESVGSSSNKIKLNFNHPCKELIWVVQPDANVDYCSSLDSSANALYVLKGAQPFNYTDALDVLPNSIKAYSSDADNGAFVKNDSEAFDDADFASGTSDAASYVMAETGLNMHCWGENPVVVAKVQRPRPLLGVRAPTSSGPALPAPYPQPGHRYQRVLLRPAPWSTSRLLATSATDNATLQLPVQCDRAGY